MGAGCMLTSARPSAAAHPSSDGGAQRACGIDAAAHGDFSHCPGSGGSGSGDGTAQHRTCSRPAGWHTGARQRRQTCAHRQGRASPSTTHPHETHHGGSQGPRQQQAGQLDHRPGLPGQSGQLAGSPTRGLDSRPHPMASGARMGTWAVLWPLFWSAPHHQPLSAVTSAARRRAMPAHPQEAAASCGGSRERGSGALRRRLAKRTSPNGRTCGDEHDEDQQEGDDGLQQPGASCRAGAQRSAPPADAPCHLQLDTAPAQLPAVQRQQASSCGQHGGVLR